MDSAVQDYIDAIDAEHRPLFDRFHRLVVEEFPDVRLVLSYKMPTFTVGECRLYVGVWKHGLSCYGWGEGGDGGFVDRHPELSSGKGTIKLPLSAADRIGDRELRALIRGTLAPTRAG